MKIKRFTAATLLSTSIALATLTGCGASNRETEGFTSQEFMKARDDEGRAVASMLNMNTSDFKVTYDAEEGNIHLMPIGETADAVKNLILYFDATAWDGVDDAIADVSVIVDESSDYNFGVSLLNPYKGKQVIMTAFQGKIIYFYFD